MAYSFDKINSLFGGQDKDQKVNIFGDQGQSQDQGQTGGAPQDSSQPKVSDAGDLGNGASPSAATSGGEAKPQAAAPQGAAEVIKKNAGKQQAPQSVQNIGTSLDAADKGLQDEANSYVSNAKAQDYSMKPDDLEGAISEKTPGDKSAAVLSRLSQAAPTADAFQPKTNVNVDDVNLLRPQTDATGRQSNVGLEQLLRRDYGPEYSGNQAQLDVNLLTRTPQFNLIRDQLVNRQDALAKQAKDYQTSKTKEAQDAETANFDTGTKGIKDYLGNQSSSLIDANKKEVDQENAARAALRQTLSAGGSVADLDSRSKAAMAKLNEDFKAGNPRALQFLQESGVNPQDFYAVSGDLDREKDYGQFIDQGESQRFNRINELLGNKDSLAAGQIGDRAGFNAGAYSDAVSKAALGKRGAADQGLQGSIDQIMAGAHSRAAAENDARLHNLWNTKEHAQQGSSGTYNELVGKYGQDAADAIQGKIDPSSYYNVNGNVTDEQELSPDDVMKLQEMQSQLGATPQQYKIGGIGDRASFDTSGYRTALESLLKGSRSDLDAKAEADRQHKLAQQVGVENDVGQPVYGTPINASRDVGSLIERGTAPPQPLIQGAAEQLGIPAPQAPTSPPSPLQLPQTAVNDFNAIKAGLKKKRFF